MKYWGWRCPQIICICDSECLVSVLHVLSLKMWFVARVHLWTFALCSHNLSALTNLLQELNYSCKSHCRRVCICACACVWEKERERGYVCVWERKRVCVRACVKLCNCCFSIHPSLYINCLPSRIALCSVWRSTTTCDGQRPVFQLLIPPLLWLCWL